MVERDRFGNLHNRRNCISKRNKISLIAQNKRSCSPGVIVYFLKSNILYQRRCVCKIASPLFIHFAIPLTSVSCKATAYDSLRACFNSCQEYPLFEQRFYQIFFCKDNKNVPSKEHFLKIDLTRNKLTFCSLLRTSIKFTTHSSPPKESWNQLTLAHFGILEIFWRENCGGLRGKC